MGSIPGLGTKILHAVQCGQDKTKQKKKQVNQILVKYTILGKDNIFKDIYSASFKNFERPSHLWNKQGYYEEEKNICM